MSTVFRVQKNSNYTTMSNYHLKDRRLSYKAKGLLSVILSLPPDWDYSLKGLAHISGDGLDSVRGGINELEKFGYISRGVQTRDKRGRMSANEYFVYENPEQNPYFSSETENGSTEPNSTALENPTRSENDEPTALDFPITENPSTDNPITENPTTGTYYNNKILTNQVLNNQSINQSNVSDRIDKTDNSPPSDFSFSVPKEKKDIGDKRTEYREQILENIEYEFIAEAERVQVDELVNIMLDVICSKSPTVRANGGDLPIETVRSRFLSLDNSHIEYVLDALKRCSPDIHNIRAYLITTLYNAPVTIDNYYAAMANHDMHIGKI